MIILLKIRRGNSILRIKPEALDYYMSCGYSLIDENGKVVKKAIPATKEELHRAYIENTDTIKQLEAKIEELQSEIEVLKKPAVKATRTTAKKKQ